MSQRRELDLDQVLAEFLEFGPTRAPDRILDGALDEVASVRQRRSVATFRRPQMQPIWRVILAAVLIVVAALAGITFIGSRPTVVPLPSSLASPAATGPVATAAASPSLAAAPSTTAPTVTAVDLAAAALSRVDDLLGATGTSFGNPEDQTYVRARVDSLNGALAAGDTAAAAVPWQELSARVDAVGPSLDDATRTNLVRDVASLGRMLDAVPFASGVLDAGTYFSTRLTEVVAVAMPAGWSRNIEDREVLALRKGPVWLAFDHTTPAASADSLAGAAPTPLLAPPETVTLGRFAGFAGAFEGPGLLWLDSAGNGEEALPGWQVDVWVVDLGGRPLTIHLYGPKPDVQGILPEVEGILATLESL